MALVVTNGRIWTGTGFATSVVIEGDRITSVNAESVSSAPRGARLIDVEGRLVLPGFIDSHTHFISGGLQLSRVPLRDVESSEAFAVRLAEQAHRQDRGTWIQGSGWDEQRWVSPHVPTRQMIDAVTTEHPIFVSRMDMHMALANSVALRLAGVTRETPDPPGGTIVRDAAGEPTGLLKDTAMSLVSRVVPPPSAGERRAAARAAMHEAAQFGATSVCDMGMSPEAFEDLRAWQALEREGALTMRVSMFTPIRDYQRLKDAGIEKRFGNTLRIGGLKGFADGSLGSGTAAFFDPYSDEPGNRGLLMEEVENGSMAAWIADADAHELQVALHAIGDRANAEVLSIFEARPDSRARRFRIEHAQHLNPELIQRMAAAGVVASMQPYHAADDGRWAESRIGAARAKGAYAIRSLIDAGVVVSFGSDWTVAPLNPMLGLHAAVTRRTIAGGHPGGWIPEEKIGIEQAIRCYTENGAWALFAENELGRIAPGMFADLVVLSDDLFTIPPEAIPEVRADLTMQGGRVVFERA